jgi:hypothetical protein
MIELGFYGNPFWYKNYLFSGLTTDGMWFNSLSAKSVLAGEKLVATYSIST